MKELRFKVITVTGWPIMPAGRTAGRDRAGLSATVLDTFYGSEHSTFRSEQRARGPGAGKAQAAIGPERALALAMERCAELNEWDEREAARSVA